ncbi:MAG: PKD domain-containing protein, partial [Flavobacteriales bacterium]|nr:PKD domain-containing protein [Flavobacteriales bacterium]
MRKSNFKLFILILLGFLTYSSVNACDGGSLNITNATDNGDGTYTYTVNFCIGLSPNWDVTTGFTFDVGGANIISTSTSSLTNTYTYCDGGLSFNGQNCESGNVMGAGPAGGTMTTVSPTANGSVMGGSLTFSSGSNPPFAPNDAVGSFDADCGDCGNPNNFCFNVTFTTDAQITSTTVTGAEGGACNYTDTSPPPLSPPAGCADLPTASFSTSGGPCEGDSYSFSNTGSSGTTMGAPLYTYAWTFPSGSPSSSTDEDASGVVWASDGSYDVELTICDVDDATCCATTVQTINVGAIPILTATPTDETCAGLADGSIDLSVSGGTGSYSYSWDNGAGTGQDPSGLAPGTYTVVVTDDNSGCIVQISAVIAAGPGPVAALTATGSGCVSSNSFSFDGTGSTPDPGGMGGPTYDWDFDDGNTSSGTNDSQTHSFTTAGTFNVSVTVTDGACSSTATTSVTVIANITLTAVPTPESCDGVNDGSIDLTVTGGS